MWSQSTRMYQSKISGLSLFFLGNIWTEGCSNQLPEYCAIFPKKAGGQDCTFTYHVKKYHWAKRAIKREVLTHNVHVLNTTCEGVPTASTPWGHRCSPPILHKWVRAQRPLEKSTRIVVFLSQTEYCRLSFWMTKHITHTYICDHTFVIVLMVSFRPHLLTSLSYCQRNGWEMASEIVNRWPWHLLHRKWQLNISHKLNIASETYIAIYTQASREMFIMALSPKKKTGLLGKLKKLGTFWANTTLRQAAYS